MDKKDLKNEYQRICKILGFGIPEYIEMQKKYFELDDYRMTELDKLGNDFKAREFFSEAHRVYVYEPKKFKELYE